MRAIKATPSPWELSAPDSVARLTAKIGAGFRQYPRQDGVLVPRALAALAIEVPGAGLPLPALSLAARLRLGRIVVAAVSQSIRRLPAKLLATSLPPPDEVVRSWPIEHRSRNTIERLIPFSSDGRPWTVARYLGVPHFGTRCLVDLLAAHEESSAESKASPAPAARATSPLRAEMSFAGLPLEELALLLGKHLPLGERDLASLLPGASEDSELSLVALVRAFTTAGVTVPFRVIRRGTLQVAVSPASSGVAAALYESAARQVASWGLSEVDAVVSRVEVLKASSISGTSARRLLLALPRLRWLDDRMTWFSFVDERSPLGAAIRKVFAVATSVDLDALATALAKNHPIARRAPSAVFAAYLSKIADCLVAGGRVYARPSHAAIELPDDEAALVRCLLEQGGEADLAALRRTLPTRSAPRTTLERLVRRSPLFLETRVGTLRLVGTGGARRTEPSRREALLV